MPDEAVLARIHERIDELIEQFSEVRTQLSAHLTFCQGQTIVVERHKKLINGDNGDGMRLELDRLKGYQRRHRWWILSLAGVSLTSVASIVTALVIQWMQKG